jgi:hypothetical protein
VARTGVSGDNPIAKASTAEKIRDFFRSYKLSLALRFLLGAMIMLSVIPKLMDIETNSVYLVYGYYVLPIQPVNIARFFGLIVPYIELLIGLGLIFGVLTRLSAIGWTIMSLAYFIIKLVIIFVQGRIIPCGCFSTILPDMSVTQSVWLDVISILFCVQIILANRGKQLLSCWSLLPEKWQKSKLRYIW